MSGARCVDVSGIAEPFGCVLTDRFEESIPLVAPDVGSEHERLFDEPREIDDLERVDVGISNN